MIIDAMRNKEFETSPSIMRDVFYGLERAAGNFLFRKKPPIGKASNLLNLGCGPLHYAGWCNADDYAFKRWMRERSFRPEWRLDITKPWMCESNFWDGIFTQHVIEHIRYSQAIFVMEECFRTLKPGAWIRISVPSLSKYIDYYDGKYQNLEFQRFPSKALAISYMTQMHYHKSIWDGDLMSNVLKEIGFEKVFEFGIGEGINKILIKDQLEKGWESLYVEAQKPI